MHRHPRRRSGPASSAWLIAIATSCALSGSLPHAAFAAESDDVVILKNGGRVRGAVVEEDPVKGVRIKLSDGSMRTLKAAEVKEVRYATPAAPPPPAPTPAPAPPPSFVGALHVEAAAPGKVSVDGIQIGPTPADIGGLAPGMHRVRIEFDDGGHRQDEVYIQPGPPLQWSFAAPEPSHVKPFQLEGGAYVGHGTRLGGHSGCFERCTAADPFGTGIGARAGALIYRIYLGVDVTYFTGASVPYVDGSGNSSSFTSNAVSVAGRVGYDIHFNNDYVTVALRPYLGIEAVLLPTPPLAATNGFAENNVTQVNFAPGLLLSAGIGSLIYIGVDARLSVLSEDESFAVFGTAGVRLF